MDKVILAYTTAPDMDVARKIAQTLVDEKLAACVSMLPGLQSIYRWQGKVEEAAEVYLIIKTKQDCYLALSDRLQSLHPYDLPELLAVPITAGLPGYLQWVKEETI